MHSEYTWLMSLVLDEEATPDEAASLREHLRTCSACAGTWQRWQEVDRRLAAAPMLSAPAGLAEMVVARVNEAAVVHQRRRRFIMWFGLASVAALLSSGLIALVAVNWPIAAPAPLRAAISGLTGVGGWLIRAATELVATAGVPTVAATTGALLCLMCGLAVAWLWIIHYGAARASYARVNA